MRAAAICAPVLLCCVAKVDAGGVVQGCTELALRAALVGGGTVTFSNDCSIALAQQVSVFQATTIDALGHNVIISGSNAVPLFNAAANLTLRGLTLANGRSTSAGAALYVHPSVTVIANHCVFSGNAVLATNGLAGTIGGTNSAGTGQSGSPGFDGQAALGGAVYNQGDLALINCTLSNNSATAGSGGAGGAGGNGSGTFAVGGNGGNGGNGGTARGGAVYNLNNLTVLNCTFSGNSVTGGSGGAAGAGGSGSNPGMAGDGGGGGIGSGGALYNAQNLTLAGSTFSTNSATGGNPATAGMAGNGTGLTGKKGAAGSGGGLFNDWWAVATNCTFYANTVHGGAGGNGGNGGGTFGVPGDGGDGGDGIGGSVASDNTLTMVTCTLSSGAAFGGTNGVAGAGNFTGSNGNLGSANGGNLANSGPILNLFGTILTSSASGNNVFGDLTDAGYNLSSDFVSSFQGTSLQQTEPKLGALRSNGGPTVTMALLSGSPAVDKIPANLTPPTDQRGFDRPVNGAGDIGAFELGAATNVTSVTLSMTRTANGLQVTGQGSAGANYLVQTSTNLIHWQTIATNLAPIQFTVPVTNLSSSFYRLSR